VVGAAVALELLLATRQLGALVVVVVVALVAT
jgi:hypothetical protein